MRLRFVANSSNSSPARVTGMRRDRSPAMISRLVRLIESSLVRTFRLMRPPPTSASASMSNPLHGKVVVNNFSVL
jgi:hypothetical protein